MDIYRVFHPHHNPRLRRTRLRFQELCELGHVAAELTRALEAAQQRTNRQPIPPILGEHFSDLIKASRFIETSLRTLCEVHPGDDSDARKAIASERAEFTGWEGWTRAFSAVGE